MKFCEACENILVVKIIGGRKILFCRACSKEHPFEEQTNIEDTNKNQTQAEGVSVFSEGNNTQFPVTKTLCPRCEKEVDAYWTMQQTRGGDEPPTRFYRCKECNHVWRDYS